MPSFRLTLLTTATVMALGLIGALCEIHGKQGDQPIDIVQFPSCPLCNMDRAQFAHSRVMVYYEDHSAFGACSIHCAAIDMAAKMGLTPERIDVADVNTRQLIDADDAHWVLGGDIPGVMTRRAKWAFADSGSAQAFVREHGGDSGFRNGPKGRLRGYVHRYADDSAKAESQNGKEGG